MQPSSVDTFLAELEHQRQASPHTLKAYGRDLRHLLEFAAGTNTAPEQIAPPQLKRLLMKLHGAGLSPRAIARMLSAWRTYYRWLAKRGGIERNPCDGLHAPKQPKTLPKAISTDQLTALLDAVPEDELERRDHAMAELFYSSGLRLSELASLDLNFHLDLVENEVTVRGKRNKTRTVPVGDKAKQALHAWIEERAHIAKPDETALFVNRTGTRLSVSTIERRIGRWAQKHGLGMHVHPHMLRHSFASHLLQSSGDLRAVQELLGHGNIGTTQIYTHLDFQHLAKVYDQAHPRARKK
ncbi:MAG TPA: tyrosine recombinase XerC [Rhodocyclaceae bacterium]|jgi:integrase/recombinase XerC|nr:tyrosine recombinase XerC [Rhodocyclaceae bacterium]